MLKFAKCLALLAILVAALGFGAGCSKAIQGGSVTAYNHK